MVVHDEVEGVGWCRPNYGIGLNGGRGCLKECLHGSKRGLGKKLTLNDMVQSKVERNQIMNLWTGPQIK